MKKFKLIMLILVGLCVVGYGFLAIAGEKVHASAAFFWVLAVFAGDLNDYLEK